MPHVSRSQWVARTVCWKCSNRTSIRSQKRRLFDVVAPLTQSRHASSSNSSYTESSDTPPFYPPPEKVTKAPYTVLHDKALLRLQGPDVVSFLNGLLPSRLQPLPETVSNPTFTAFLTAKGRLLYDVFIYPPTASKPEDPWYLEVDLRSASALLSHLKKHKLRSKFKLEKVATDDMGVLYIWPGAQDSVANKAQVGGKDPRPLMGSRILVSPNDLSSAVSDLKSKGESFTPDDYKIHRMLAGHAEGPTELIATSALPQESNLDFYDGIDFHKGCYLGQELTIRTHHTGVVRKRVLPCQISSKAIQTSQQVPTYDETEEVLHPPPELNISKYRAGGRAGRSTGKWLGSVGNVGLALCRLEMMTDMQLTAEGTTYSPEDQFRIVWEDSTTDADGKSGVHEVFVKPFVPSWLRKSIESSIQARSERSRKKRIVEDDDEEDG